MMKKKRRRGNVEVCFSPTVRVRMSLVLYVKSVTHFLFCFFYCKRHPGTRTKREFGNTRYIYIHGRKITKRDRRMVENSFRIRIERKSKDVCNKFFLLLPCHVLLRNKKGKKKCEETVALIISIKQASTSQVLQRRGRCGWNRKVVTASKPTFFLFRCESSGESITSKYNLSVCCLLPISFSVYLPHPIPFLFFSYISFFSKLCPMWVCVSFLAQL